MCRQNKRTTTDCPVTSDAAQGEAGKAFDELVQFCRTSDLSFLQFEKQLLIRVAVLGCALIRLFLTSRHERLQIERFLEDGKYRRGDPYATRTLKTVYGDVTYGRRYLQLR